MHGAGAPRLSTAFIRLYLFERPSADFFFFFSHWRRGILPRCLASVFVRLIAVLAWCMRCVWCVLACLPVCELACVRACMLVKAWLCSGQPHLPAASWPFSASFRPLDVYIYVFGSKSCRNRLNRAAAVRLAAPNKAKLAFSSAGGAASSPSSLAPAPRPQAPAPCIGESRRLALSPGGAALPRRLAPSHTRRFAVPVANRLRPASLSSFIRSCRLPALDQP